MAEQQGTEEYRELKGKFAEFLDDDVRPWNPGFVYATTDRHTALLLLCELHAPGDYPHAIREMMHNDSTRLRVDAGHLRTYDAQLAARILHSPSTAMPALEDALDETVRNLDAKYVADGRELHVGIVGSVGNHRVNPRSLLSTYLGQLVCVEGIVTKCSMVHPKIVKSVHYCEATGEFISREYRDATAYSGMPTQAVYPTKDDNGLCKFRDQQTVTVQEAPESAPAGQLPRSVDVILHDDLVDSCKPGDRVCITGIYKALPSRNAATLSGIFRTALIGNATVMLRQENTSTEFSESDVENFKELARQDPKDLLNLMGQSLAPSIYGHDDIKKALVLVLLGGLEKNLPNGTHLRGDINCLLVGDPSVAKSQLLRSILGVAPLAVSTTGRGSSGVGLTAAVTKDSETGDRKLEAGAMVLADRGIVCIDEFDKMGDADRVAIHEVMEQQTVTVAKAGIHTSLNARCSVIAAANPKYGSYSHNASVAENLNLPDSILSRFDLLFIMLDQSDDAMDSEISDHVLRLHRFRGVDDYLSGGQDRGTGATAYSRQAEEQLENGAGDMYVKYDSLLSGGRSGSKGGRKQRSQKKLLHPKFFQKFIHYAKERPLKPRFNDDAAQMLADQYTEWRARADASYALPVSPRTMETMIRLATAHAKLRLSKAVTQEDAQAALSLMSRVLKGTEWQPDEPESAQHHGANRDVGGTDHRTDEDVDDQRRRSHRKAQTSDRKSSTRKQSEQHREAEVTHQPLREEIDDAQRTRFRDAMSHQFKFTDTLTVNDALQAVNNDSQSSFTDPITKGEAIVMLRELAENEPNSFLYSEDEEQFWLLG